MLADEMEVWKETIEELLPILKVLYFSDTQQDNQPLIWQARLLLNNGKAETVLKFCFYIEGENEMETSITFMKSQDRAART